ncbi:MAG TPA: hypothetical protein VMZ27_06160 [Candidatus Saccharimonadales bacterium]|nr:hypothetical protein [Candidatus Saccharimonadales bacterium]
MKRQVLLIISSDPRTSARPAEAVRIAAGVVPWLEVRMQICFCNEAVLALDELSADFPDGDVFEQHLPRLVEHELAPWVERTSASLKHIKNPLVSFKEVSTDQLAQFAAGCDYVLNF